MMARCPYCGFEASAPHEEIAHMEAEHPNIIESRLAEAGLRQFIGLRLLGRERSLADVVVKDLMAATKHPTRGPYERGRGAMYEIEVTDDEGTARVYRVTVELQPR